MASRASLNKVLLIGNLTRDPELRYTPQGNAVCTFGLATNRSWVPADGGERREETEFHRIVAWNKLAELCAQLLTKGRKVFVEGRLQTRQWQTPDGQPRQVTEIVIDDMRILDSRKTSEVEDLSDIEETIMGEVDNPELQADSEGVTEPAVAETGSKVSKESKEKKDSKKKVDAKTMTKGDASESDNSSQNTQSDEEEILSDLPF